MSLKDLLGGAVLLGAAALIPSQAQAEESKPKQEQAQERRKITIQELRKQNIEQKLDDLYHSIDSTRLREIARIGKTIAKQKDKPKLPGLLGKVEAILRFYKRIEGTFISIEALDPKMHLYRKITGDVIKPERDLRNIIYILKKKKPTDKEIRDVLKAYEESEPVVTAAALAYREINKSKSSRLKESSAQKRKFQTTIELLYPQNLKILSEEHDLTEEKITEMLEQEMKKIYIEVKQRAISTIEWETYLRRAGLEIPHNQKTGNNTK